VRVWEELVARYDQRIESLAPDLARELGELRATQRH
jgi:hypothetical protein